MRPAMPTTTATHLTATATSALTALVDDLDAIEAASGSSPPPPAAVAAALRPYLGRRDLLDRCQRRSSRDGYRANVVHVHPAGRYSIVALVWRPGQRTPIHSHASWCVVGVHEGREQERSFRHLGTGVVESSRRTMVAGDVAWLDAG